MRLGKGLIFGALLCAVSLIVGCGGGGGGSVTFFPDPKIHYVNGSPDSTALDFMIDDTTEASALPFLGLAPTVSVSPGDHDVTVEETGTTFQLDSITNTFNSNTDTIICTIGLENYGQAGANPEYLKRIKQVLFTADLKAPNGAKSNLIIVQGFNSAPGIETPNVDFTPPGTNPLNPVTNISYGQNKTATIDSGTHEFVVVRTGTTPPTPYIDSTFTFVSGKTYLALLTGEMGGTGNMAPQVKYIALN